MKFRTSTFLAGMIAALFVMDAHAAEAPKPFRYEAENRRDPFVPLILNNRLTADSGQQMQDLGKPILYGILWDASGNSIALIDNLELKVGGMVQGYKVVAIRKDAVELEANGQSVELKIAFDAQSTSAPKGGE